MPAKSQRLLKIADLIQHNLALILKRHISDPRLANIVLTRVDVAPDLTQARVYFTALKNEEAKTIVAVLTKASGRMRSLLAESAALRYTPRLIFVYDDVIVRAERIDDLLKDVSPQPDDTEEQQ